MANKENDSSNTKIVFIESLPIKLGQLLKIADCVQDGIEAKIRIQGGEVLVNNEIETRRGRQLKEGDIVTYANMHYLITQNGN